ncbi:hypothetical protein D3C75_1198350 [compost metagenome]
MHAALVLRRTPATHQAVTLHARQHTGHARLEDAGLLGQLIALQLTVLAQDADDPPLLLGQAVLIERWTKKTHGRFTGLQQGQCQ